MDSEHDITSGPEGVQYYWITMEGALAGAITASFGLVEPWPRDACKPPESFFKRLRVLLKDFRPVAEHKAVVVAFNLLFAASEACLRTARPDKHDDRIETARSQLSRHFSNPDLSVRSLARDARMNRSMFSRLFHQRVGVSPKQYLTSLRINRAATFLKETNLPVREIARQTGFRDMPYFIRAFRRGIGLSPGRFRSR